MKKIVLVLLTILTGANSYSQNFNPTFSINNSGVVNGFTGGYTFSYATSGSPWNGAFMSFGGFTNNYDCQISTDYGPNGGSHISFRTRNGDISTWNPWNEIWHSGNLNNINTDFTARNVYVGNALGIGTTSPNGNLEVKGTSAFDASTIFRITNSAGDFGRTSLILTGRIQQQNDAWTFGSGARNAIVFAENAAGSQQNIGSLGDEKVSMQLEGNSSSLGFLTKQNGNIPSMVLTQSGYLGIGTTSPDQALTVKGTVHSNAVIVDTNIFPDYVFDKNYDLASLKDVKAYIDQNHHLPEIPSAAEVVKDGINLGEMNARLLKKIEELTLYLIEKDKESEAQKKINQTLQDQINQLNTKISSNSQK